MHRLAVLLTCFNRKEKTLSALKALHTAFETSGNNYEMSIYLTDDGSTDGTSQIVAENFPQVKIFKGTGSLYWAGGMRNSWGEALKGNYDAYLLLNDDTNVYPNLFDAVDHTHDFCLKNHSKGGVYVGTTVDASTKKMTYGGAVFKNRFLAKIQRVKPKDVPIPCELGNANIMWVSKNVVDRIGKLSDGYVHGMADYDYTLMALKKKLPIYLMPGAVGECTNDHSDKYIKFFGLSRKERKQMLYHPLGFDFISQSYHMKKHFPLRYPFFVMVGHLKVLFPKVYYHLLYKKRKHL